MGSKSRLIQKQREELEGLRSKRLVDSESRHDSEMKSTMSDSLGDFCPELLSPD